MDPKRQKAIAEFIAKESQKRRVIVVTKIPEFSEVLNGLVVAQHFLYAINAKQKLNPLES